MPRCFGDETLGHTINHSSLTLPAQWHAAGKASTLTCHLGILGCLCQQPWQASNTRSDPPPKRIRLYGGPGMPPSTRVPEIGGLPALQARHSCTVRPGPAAQVTLPDHLLPPRGVSRARRWPRSYSCVPGRSPSYLPLPGSASSTAAPAPPPPGQWAGRSGKARIALPRKVQRAGPGASSLVPRAGQRQSSRRRAPRVLRTGARC